MLVDSHSHVSLSWYEPLEALLFQMDRNGVDKAVLVQMWSELDNSYQVECVARYPDRLSSVVMLDASAPDAVRQMRRLVDEGAVGIRLRPGTRSPGEDPKAIWRAAESAGTTVSCVGSPDAFASEGFREIIEEVPGLTIVIEHIGELQPAAAGYQPEVADAIFDLARFRNVYMKIHGLGEFAVRDRNPIAEFPFVTPVPNLTRRACESFGADRVMWGSDYPPVSRREGYGNALKFTRAELAHLADSDLDQIFGGTAAAVYNLAPVAAATASGRSLS